VPTKNLIIKGGKKGDLGTDYLEEISELIVRAKLVGAQIEISLDIFQYVLNELIKARHQELADSKEIDQIVSDMESGNEPPYLKVSESRQEPFDFTDLEITDLEQIGGPTRPSATAKDEEDEEEEEMVVMPPPRRRSLSQKRREYWLPALNLARVLCISLLGFLVLAILALLGG
jgi:hypothetical protein